MNKEQAWHSTPIQQLISHFETNSENGLSSQVVVSRRNQVGLNELPASGRARWWHMFLRQWKSPLVYLLFLAALLTAWLGDTIDTTVILFSIAITTGIGFFQEYRASDLLEKLKTAVRVEALVIREEKIIHVDASELVPGDVIIVKAGSKIPADSRILEAGELEVAETILTGESVPVVKRVGETAADTPLADRTNMIWMGTTVERGEVRAIVVATGVQTQVGMIAELSASAGRETTPLQERLERFANLVSLIVVSAAGILFVVGVVRGLALHDVFTTAVAVAVSAIPEGLTAALSVVLAVSTARILSQKGLVRRPVAAETLGSVTVICTDKTGTLTEGVMKVEELVSFGDEEDALLSMLFANEALIEEAQDGPRAYGEATDRAKFSFVFEHRPDIVEQAKQYRPLGLLPFEANEKYIAAFRHDGKTDRVHCFVSGAAEVLLHKSVQDGNGQPLTPEYRTQLIAQAETFAEKGFRVIGVAGRTLAGHETLESELARRGHVHDLHFYGFAVLRDPIRADVPAVLAESRRAGIRIMMITGDHRLTAITIGRELGFRSDLANVIDGIELDRLSDGDLAERIHNIDIVVRVNPEHKLRIVQALIARGEAVAMTGDGINDAPALRAADIGVAVGSATDITKEAADLVLLDDGFRTIVAAIREGRIAFENIKKVTLLLLSGSFTVLLLTVSSLFLGLPLPLSAAQILWANLVENGLPTFALAFEKGEGDVMRRPPDGRGAPLIDRQGKALLFGAAIARDVILVGFFVWLSAIGTYELTHLRTLMFALVSTDSLVYMFAMKSFREPLWRVSFFDNRYFLLSVAAGFVMVFLAIYLPMLNTFLRTVPLSLHDLGIVGIAAVLDLVLIEGVKSMYRGQRAALTLATA